MPDVEYNPLMSGSSHRLQVVFFLSPVLLSDAPSLARPFAATSGDPIALQKNCNSPTSTQHKDMRILISSKYDAPMELKPLSPAPPALSAAIDKFCSGTLSAADLASSAIEELFERDFVDGKHWSRDGCSRTIQPDGSFLCSASATWDWKDIYSVAKSTAVIYVDPTELRITSYSYYVSG